MLSRKGNDNSTQLQLKRKRVGWMRCTIPTLLGSVNSRRNWPICLFVFIGRTELDSHYRIRERKAYYLFDYSVGYPCCVLPVLSLLVRINCLKNILLLFHHTLYVKYSAFGNWKSFSPLLAAICCLQ